MYDRRYLVGGGVVCLLITALALGGCGEKQYACDIDDLQTCECPYGVKGVSYCLENRSGFTDCICPLKEMVPRSSTQMLDQQGITGAERVGERGIRFPVEGNQGLEDLQVGEYVVSLEANVGGRVTEVIREDDFIRVETEKCTLEDLFEKLDIEVNSEVNLLAHLSPEMRERWRQMTPPRPMRMLQQQRALRSGGQDTTEAGIAGVDFSFSGELSLGLEVDPATHITFKPRIYAKLKLDDILDLHHFAFVPMLHADILLRFRIFLQAMLELTGEIELVQFATCALLPEICCNDDLPCSPLRVNLSGGFELWFWLTLGCSLTLDGFVEFTPEASFYGDFAGGIVYSEDWDDPYWDNADDWGEDWAVIKANFDQARAGWKENEWTTWKFHQEEGSASIDDLLWGAHGQIKCYVKPKIEVSFLQVGGVYLTGGPYVAFDVWIPPLHLAFSVGLEALVGGEINLGGIIPIWNYEQVIYEWSQVLWEWTWQRCGDGFRSLGCAQDIGSNCADDCPSDDCDKPSEECDAGQYFDETYQGLWWAEEAGMPAPCIPPGQPGECTCAPGWEPRDHLPVANWQDFPELHEGQWGDGNNACVPQCGNGIANPGEVCDPPAWPIVAGTIYEGLLPSGEECAVQCTRDCSRAVGLCGDGLTECFEECDDGNQEDCDGCSRLCELETGCGDGVTCPPEFCDDGNTNDGDGCSADCTSAEQCGDGVTDPGRGEECDDGNWMPCDGCNWCHLEGCGDGNVCGNEECDDGNTNPCDSCNNSCQRNIGFPGRCWPDGYQCPGEQCDDGNRDDCDACHNNCTPNPGNTCGDGHVCGDEECDDGNTEDCDGCHNDCTLNYRYEPGSQDCWPDGHKCPWEECDDSSTNEAHYNLCDGCARHCRLPRCGDGIKCPPEVCDDGNNVDGDGCAADCSTDYTCGNRVVDTVMGEVCDDGNHVSGDGCRADCRGKEVCGDGYRDINERCEDTSPDGIDLNCSLETPDCSGCRTCNPRCGDGVKAPFERCEPTGDPVDPGCTAYAPRCLDCIYCTCADPADAVCGDGIICGDEECDDGNRVNCDACNNNCTRPRCGDGIMCSNEVCDDGNTVAGDGCRVDCLGLEICGDGLWDTGAGEICENTSATGIDVGCHSAKPHCNRKLCNKCGITDCGNGVVEFQGSEVCDTDTDQICVEAGTGYLGFMSCLPDCSGWSECVPAQYCGDGFQNGPEDCDDGDQDDCDGCHNDCTFNTGCGDGHVCPPEDCEDGNQDNCDGCQSNCRLETGCGDGFVCGSEFCDDGNTSNCSGNCNSTCTAYRPAPVCGDLSIDSLCGEICEDTSPSGQDSGCTVATPHCVNCRSCSSQICGDGTVAGTEACEDTAEPWNEDDGCSAPDNLCLPDCSGCVDAICGDGWPSGFEACDDGNTAGGDGCAGDCSKIEYCGDGVQDVGEGCDDGMHCGPFGTQAYISCPMLDSFCIGVPESDERCLPRSGDGCSATCTLE